MIAPSSRGRIDAALGAMASIAYEGEFRASLSGAIFALQGSLREGLRQQMIIGALTGVGYEGVTGFIDAPFAALTASAFENRKSLAPQYGAIAAAFAVVSGQMSGKLRVVGRIRHRDYGVMVGAIAGMMSDRPIGFINQKIGAIWGGGSEETRDYLLIGESIGIAAWVEVAQEILIFWNTRTRVLSAMEIELMIDASMHDMARARDSMDVEAMMAVVIRELLRVQGIFGTDANENMEVWAVNLDTRASTRYENYPFNSYAELGGRALGAKADGIFLLEGETDATTPIQAAIALGKQDFDTNQRKHVHNVYVGVGSDERMVLRVDVEGETYFYQARSSAEHKRQQRIDLGRGLRANWFEFTLLNDFGGDFEIDTIEFVIKDTQRRI
jgi:hypothetical protein